MAGWPRAPLPATCSAGAVWRPRAPGAARGASCWRLSPCCRVRPCDVRAAARGGGASRGEPRLWGSVPVGGAPRAAGWHSPPARLPGPGPLGAGLLFWISPTVPLLPALPLPRCAALWGRRGGWTRRSRVAGARARASGQWSAVSRSEGLLAFACPAPSARAFAVSTIGGPTAGVGGGRAYIRGAGACRGWCPGPSVRSQPHVLAVWGLGPSVPGVRPLSSGLGCLRAGAAAAAGSSSGSASG